MERDKDEPPVEGEGLFLTLAHTACRAHPEHLLYPMEKKLLKGQLDQEVQAWQDRRNNEVITVTWRFTTADARIKLKRLYPSLEKKRAPSSTEHVAKIV